jgi:hypothetical protein
MSLGSLALAFGLYRGLPEPAMSRLGLGLVGVWSVALLVAADFPADPQGAPQLAAGAIHRINGSIAFLSLSVGAILVSRRFERDEKWLPFHRFALILSLIMLAQFVMVTLTIALGGGYPGLGQRIFIATLLTWLLLTAARLRAIAIGAICPAFSYSRWYYASGGGPMILIPCFSAMGIRARTSGSFLTGRLLRSVTASPTWR